MFNFKICSKSKLEKKNQTDRIKSVAALNRALLRGHKDVSLAAQKMGFGPGRTIGGNSEEKACALLRT
jgi:hypothetical protein